VLEIIHDMFDEYNVAIVERRRGLDLSGIQRTVQELGQDLRDVIRWHRQHGRKVAVWGAGGKGLSILAEAGIREVDMLVDGDPYKQGLITPVSHLKVQSPSDLRHHHIDAIIITAMAYRQEIERILVEEYEFKGKVYVLGHRLEESDTWCSK
jgi:hypothetical protein